MFSKIRKRITYANVAMTLALVFAMGGGAYAAGKFIITSTKQIKPSVVAQLKGKNGKNGTNGLNGAQGPAGKNGTNGASGAPGEKGQPGEKGGPGTSVTSKEKATGTIGACQEGGSEFTAAENKKTFACNGAEGKQGAIHPGETLPPGATETGFWAVLGMPVTYEVPSLFSSASFPIELAATPSANVVRPGEAVTGAGNVQANFPYVQAVTGGPFVIDAEITDTTNPGAIPAGTTIEKVLVGGTVLKLSAEAKETHNGDSLTASVPAGCTGSSAAPTAAPGKLCLYATVGLEENVQGIIVGPRRTGAWLNFKATAAGVALVSIGSWAVTAP
jgi:Collagen triple helix repeat (20 copies)